MALFLATLYYTWRGAAWMLRAAGEWRMTVAVLFTLWVGSSLLNACHTLSPPQRPRPRSSPKTKDDSGGGGGGGASEAAAGLANGLAHSSSLRGGSAVQRSSSNKIAAADIS